MVFWICFCPNFTLNPLICNYHLYKSFRYRKKMCTWKMGLSLFRVFMVANAFNIATENPVSFWKSLNFVYTCMQLKKSLLFACVMWVKFWKGFLTIKITVFCLTFIGYLIHRRESHLLRFKHTSHGYTCSLFKLDIDTLFISYVW